MEGTEEQRERPKEGSSLDRKCRGAHVKQEGKRRPNWQRPGGGNGTSPTDTEKTGAPSQRGARGGRGVSGVSMPTSGGSGSRKGASWRERGEAAPAEAPKAPQADRPGTEPAERLAWASAWSTSAEDAGEPGQTASADPRPRGRRPQAERGAGAGPKRTRHTLETGGVSYPK